MSQPEGAEASGVQKVLNSFGRDEQNNSIFSMELRISLSDFQYNHPYIKRFVLSNSLQKYEFLTAVSSTKSTFRPSKCCNSSIKSKKSQTGLESDHSGKWLRSQRRSRRWSEAWGSSLTLTISLPYIFFIRRWFYLYWVLSASYRKFNAKISI